MDDSVCVVIVNWNGREFIRDCLRSALDQTHARYRVVVVDNGSTDGSVDLIRHEFPEVALVSLTENLHFARGTNAGIREAFKDPACAYIATLNNDTRADPEWLTELVRGAPPSVGMVASKLLFMDRARTLNSTGLCIAFDGSGMDRGWNQTDQGQFDEALDVFGPTAGAALYRRDMLESVGLFDEDFLAYHEDLDLAWRARLAGWGARFAPGAIVHHKFSASVGSASAMKTYLCERNRIWNLVQNYPWRYVALTVPWNSAWVLARPLSWNDRQRSSAHGKKNPLRDSARAMARARLDGYAGVPRALTKRRLRAAASKVDAATIGGWLRSYGVALRETVLA